MKAFPDMTIVPDKLFDLQYGVVKGQMFMTAVDLNVFNYTVEPTSSNDLAAAIGTHPGNTELFLNALASIGLLVKKDGLFRNTELTDAFLVEGKETFLGAFLKFNEMYLFKNADDMKAAVVNGPASHEEEKMDAEVLYNMTMILSNLARSGPSQAVAKAIAELPEFNGFAKMLDLGGGHGLDTIATIKMHPSMKGLVFDKAAGVQAAQDNIREYGMEERISVLAGDYFTDSLGSGYDLILAKGTLNFAGPNLENVVHKIFDAMNQGGVFVSMHDGLTEERTKPEAMVVSWLPFALSAIDVSLAKERIPAAMTAAGFSGLEIRPYHFPLGGALDMVVGRKA
ncbi:methyltransferase type 12 [candidate division KSB3 bacterium]|uniref:Methyltransferase type 12 n=1 Tax=candidate division KSB3 bacterium TaxID=2044937 RepID=A0A2G6E9M0_9BACT|nr:MAG: methyltransferase type 12 [candidate division KSB3 bacterium]